MSYKVGDVVRIVPEEVIKNFSHSFTGTGWISPEGLYIDQEMLRFCGKEVTINAESPYRLNDGTYAYIIKESAWMFPRSCIDDDFRVADFSGLEALL